MSLPYCIIDGTSYSFCTTSCIHVNLTKIALPLIEESIIDSLFWHFFFLPSCCLLQVSGRKDKILCFIPPNFSRKKFLGGLSCWTALTSSLTFERITLIELPVAKFYTWIFQLLPNSQEEACFSNSSTTPHHSLFQHFIFNVAPSLESGCKSTWTFFSSKFHHHILRVKLRFIIDSQKLIENEDCYLFIKTAISRG